MKKGVVYKLSQMFFENNQSNYSCFPLLGIELDNIACLSPIEKSSIKTFQFTLQEGLKVECKLRI